MAAAVIKPVFDTKATGDVLLAVAAKAELKLLTPANYIGIADKLARAI